MKKITLLLIGLFMMLFQINAQVAIGAGNLQAENAPFEAYFGFSYAQTVYLASEINASGDISDVQWYYSGTSALPNSQDLTIYMAELPRTEFASTDDWEPIASFTQVYNGGITVTAGTEGWVTINLDTPFTYAGTGNLVIAVKENAAGFDDFGDDFYNSQVTTNRTISYFSDITNPDPLTPPTASNIDDTIPNIILGGIAQACPTPSDLNSSGVTSDQAELSWTENGSSTSWNIELVPDGSMPSGTATNTGVGNPFTISTLTPATNYTYYVQADCGSEVSSWAGPFTFTTECVTFTAPFSEDFENAGNIPVCWSMDGGEDWFFDDDATGEHIGDDGTITGNTVSNNYFAWADSSQDEGVRTLTSPLVDVSGLSVPALSFYEISDNEGNANSTMDVEVWDGAAWNNMATYNTNTSGWELKVIDLSGLTITGDIQARFIFSETVPGDFYDDIAIDDVTFDEAPSCFAPSVLMANAITSNSAELSWSQDGTVASWNIEVVTAGTTPTGTPTETGISNPHTVNSLTAVTSYDYYVQANCGGDLSSWTGPFTFETLCDVFVPDYIENFTTLIPDCWDEADNGDATTGPTDLGGSAWVADEFLNIGTDDGAYKINLWLAAKSDWLVSPLFDLTGGPFQVEFDFGIMEFASDDTAGVLGSDDTVQLLMTVDNGVTWTTLLTYDSTSVVSASGEHPIIDLTAYSGLTVQFGILASEGTVDDPQDNDVFVDNFRVRGIPTCPEPTDLDATNLSLTSTEVSWVESGTSASWNIQYGEAGFALGAGTIESGVTTNPHVLSSLASDTSYEFYVQAICDATNTSSYAGPFQFFTGYCESIPSSIDFDGVLNVTIGTTDFPSLGVVTYENQTSPTVNVFQGVETDIEILFGHIYTYDANVWVDFNDDLIFDDAELIYQGESSGGPNPHLLAGAFTIPATAPIGEHRMRIGTADFGQDPPNPCFGGTFGVTLDFTVNVQELTCTLPEATFAVVSDCPNDQFFIEANVTSLGDATSLELSNNVDANTIQASATGAYQIGPFPFPTTVKAFVTNEQDNNCVISSDTYIVLACPPDNDDPCDATVAVVNDDILCETSTPGTILAATPSGIPDPSCGSSADDDVWFQFVAQSEFQLIALANVAGSTTTDIDHSVYSGTCDNLTEISCVADFAELSSVTPQLTIGETYFIRVYSGGANPEDTTFDLCITPYNAPINIACDLADNYCSGSDASDILYGYNTIGMPDNTPIDCLGTSPNPTYSVIEIGSSGDILIEMVQNSAFDANDNPIGDELDVDFILWGPYGSDDDLCVLSSVVDCSYSAAPVENLTLLGAQEGEIYLLLITNFEAEAGIIQVRQTNLGDAGSGSTIAETEVDIVSNEVFIDATNDPTETDEVSVCGFPSVTIEANSPFADDFIWYEDGFVIPGETSSSLTIPLGGFGLGASNYQVQAFDSQCGADAFSQFVIVNLYQDAGTIAPQNITVCDGPVADGTETFDLDALSTSLGLGTEFTVSYYTNMDDANQAISPVASSYDSSGETLIMRIEDANAAANGYLGCRQLSEVELIVNPRPNINQPADFKVCDDLDGNVDGITEFDLTSINDEITTDTDVNITYHMSEQNAEDGTDMLGNLSAYTSSGETIYVRAENTITGCHAVTFFNLEINIVPLATFDPIYSYEVCPNATVPVEIGIIPDNFTVDQVSVQWFLDDVAIPGANGIVFSSVLVQGEYKAEITFNDSGCVNSAIASAVVELDSCVIPGGISPNGDGINDFFDLSSYAVSKLEIFNRNGVLVYSKNSYTNEWVGQTDGGNELPVGTYFYTMIYDGGKQLSDWIYINR